MMNELDYIQLIHNEMSSIIRDNPSLNTGDLDDYLAEEIIEKVEKGKKYLWTDERKEKSKEIHRERWICLSSLTRKYGFIKNPKTEEIVFLLELIYKHTMNVEIGRALRVHRKAPGRIMNSLRISADVIENIEMPSYSTVLMAFSNKFGGKYRRSKDSWLNSKIRRLSQNIYDRRKHISY
jgi:hypothetical protein